VAKRELADVFGTSHNVAAGEVWVICGHIGGGPRGLTDDAVAESWCEPLDLGDDRRGGIAGIAVGHVA